MAQLSLLLETLSKPRKPKTTEPATGSTGSRTLITRNPDAGIDRERKKILESPVMQAFVRTRRRRLIF